MKDAERLKYCLNQIERKLNWDKSVFWKEPEFVQLAEIISKASDISISPHTLKRLFGKIKYKAYYNPQRATKNALAKYLGFSDWMGFVDHYNEKIDRENVPPKISFWKSKLFKAGLLLVSGILISFVFMQWFIAADPREGQDETLPFTFDLTDSIGPVPYTVSVNYNIEKFPNDSTYVNFDFTHPLFGPQIIKLDQERSLHNYTYQIPGYYQVTLQDNRHSLSTRNVLATSDDWESYLYYEDKQGLWLDNKIKPSEKSGYLYYNPETLVENGFDVNAVYYTIHRFFREFEIDGDNFEMKVRFKNSKETGGITCYDFVTRLYGKNNLVYLNLMETGCSGYSGIKIGDTEITGDQENLSAFTFNDESWNVLNVVVKNQKVRFSLNGKLIYTGAYQGSNGKIVGIEHVFKGTGMLDYIRLKDFGTQVEFFDDFE
ncbi:hypothetical protein SAMN05421636_1079 [Pricia antarctica]|uniref:Uncharacterized protein n=1 Tax=Pricia antarctica TaxID=641691 RepID=A0A1G7F8R6_9FLAO|nr:hypothetical protein [Pricia antarctica]SDE72328.1 hypothetical protein SAMN05421636_1079 [Pricia antarctica]